jgi:hypothetical protein
MSILSKLPAMIQPLVAHTWKRLFRSVSFGKELATNIFLAFLALMLVGYSLALGFALETIITKGLKQADSMQFLNGLLLYYFGFEFMIRYFMQNLPVFDVQPYLHLPLKRANIVHHLLVRSWVHVLNASVPLLFTPFAFSVVAVRFGNGAAWSWLLTLCAISFCVHYLIVLFKKGLDDTLIGFLILIGIFGFAGAADYYNWFKLSDVSRGIFSYAVSGPYLFLLTAGFLALLYGITFQFFLKSLYPEELVSQKTTTWGAKQDWAFLQNYGLVGEWINLEIKLILRNKRTRNVLFLSAFFLLYGLIFYTRDRYTEGMPGFLLFIGIFITGIFMINYGQFLFSWQGGHFDFNLTRPISLRQYVESKYWLLTSVTVVCFLLSIPYVYFGWKILLIQAAMTLFNLGINIYVIMNMAMWEPKKIDLRKGTTFNYEGVGAAQWIMGIPILVGPYVFYLPFSLAGYPNLGLMAVAFVGLVGIALKPYLLKLTTQRLEAKRYTIAAGFRKD